MQKIKDLNKYLIKKKDKYIVNNKLESMKLKIPIRFQNRGFLNIRNVVSTIGIMKVEIDNKFECGFYFLSMIDIIPSEIDQITEDEDTYLLLTLHPGDVFIDNVTVMKYQDIIYAVYVEFIENGNIPKFMSYNDITFLLDQAKEICDANIPVEKSILEMIFSHVCRTKKDPFEPFRYTDLKQDNLRTIALSQYAVSVTGVGAKLSGSRLDDSLDSVLLGGSQDRERNVFDDILRGNTIDSK